jgi:hypothetical protein
MIVEIFLLILAICILAAIVGLGMYIYHITPTSRDLPPEIKNLAEQFIKTILEFKPYHAPPVHLTDKEIKEIEEKQLKEYVDVTDAMNEAYEEAMGDGKKSNKTK